MIVVAAALPVFAQVPAPSPSPAPTRSEYVEVVATRIPELAEEVPMPIEVITGEELRNWGATDLRSALALADAYGTVSASLGYRASKWDFRLDGRNLNDARDPVAESELGDAQYYRMTARRIDLTVSRWF